MKKLFVSILFLTFLTFCNTPHSGRPVNEQTEQQPEKIRNIIFMVGDGMGITQITAGLIASKNKLALERIQYIGLHKSFSADKLITDSAAGATAFSTGIKTNNNAVGVGPDSVAHETILEAAHKNGLSTGLVVTSSITHATPASFYAHQPFRQMYEAIAFDLIKKPVDIFVGGGQNYFDNRSDSINLIDSLREDGFTVLNDVNDISKVDNDHVAVFTAAAEPPSLLEGRDQILTKSLPTVLEKLNKNEKGFFLMVEGSQIDWGGHANDSDYIIEEVLDFDDAIGQVLDFAEKEGNTLIVITADHETGGYAITDGSLEEGKVVGKFSTDYHTPVMIPVFAFGPGAEKFIGIYENTSIYEKMMNAYAFNSPL